MDKYSEIRVPIAHDNCSIKRKESKCVLCGKCKDVCKKKMGVAGFWKYDSEDIVCINCGQCANVCPVDAITEQDDSDKLLQAIDGKEKTVIFITSPATRVSLGEMFDLPAGEFVAGKMVSALKKLGAKYVFDVTFGADLTIMEEASELVDRIKNNKVLPQFTSCCPAWVKFVETFYPQYIPNLSSCKSPISMQASVIKNYFAKQQNINPKDIYLVAVTPCVAKKFEIKREELTGDYGFDTDLVISVRELGKLLKKQKVNFKNLKDEEFDTAFPTGSGAGVIFGASGGVMEAAVRTAYKLVTGNELGDVNYTPVRGLEDVKKAEVDLNGIKVRLAVVHQMSNVAPIVEEIRKAAAEGKERPYDFIEVMACRGGCVTGGGQPYGHSDELRVKRAAALYTDDETHEIRCSHQNPLIDQIYKEYFGQPNSEKAHHLLHTHYTKRPLYK